MEDIIIGSGPAGVSAAWALIKQGRKVTMLDVGETLEVERHELRSKLAAVGPKQWQPEDLDAYTGIAHAGDVAGPQPFGSNFLFRDTVGFSDGVQITGPFGLRPSFAKGGLSNGWGSSILPYRQQDMMDWPARARDLSSHYEALRQFMPMAGKADDLENLFPMLGMPQDTSLPLSSQAGKLLSRLEKNKNRLNRAGIYFGQARQAVASRECQHCGLCLYGCPYGVVYNAAQTIDRLLESTAFSYRKGCYVTRFEENDSGVQLWATDISSKQSAHFSANRLFVACGVLPTARLVMNSLEYFDRPIHIKDSLHFFLPLLHSWRPQVNLSQEETNRLVQLFIEIISENPAEKTAHAQLYTFNHFYAPDMRKRFGRFATILSPLINKLSQRLIVAQVFLHSDYSSKIEVRLLKKNSDNILQMKEIPNTATQHSIARIIKKLSKMALTAGLIPLTPLSRQEAAGSSFHCGSTFPMQESPVGIESDTLGRPAGLQRVFVVDASVLPSVPATTITLSVMANAHRIATESANIPN